jgi:hypothetical protein
MPKPAPKTVVAPQPPSKYTQQERNDMYQLGYIDFWGADVVVAKEYKAKGFTEEQVYAMYLQDVKDAEEAQKQ